MEIESNDNIPFSTFAKECKKRGLAEREIIEFLMFIQASLMFIQAREFDFDDSFGSMLKLYKKET